MNGFGSRKFIFAVVSMAINTLLVATKTITPDVWGTVTTTLVGAYMIGNVGEKWVERK